MRTTARRMGWLVAAAAVASMAAGCGGGYVTARPAYAEPTYVGYYGGGPAYAGYGRGYYHQPYGGYGGGPRVIVGGHPGYYRGGGGHGGGHGGYRH